MAETYYKLVKGNPDHLLKLVKDITTQFAVHKKARESQDKHEDVKQIANMRTLLKECLVGELVPKARKEGRIPPRVDNKK